MAARDTERRPDHEETEEDADHLAEVPDGCGCTEMWEHLSGRRE